jgi:hypothetical protein
MELRIYIRFPSSLVASNQECSVLICIVSYLFVLHVYCLVYVCIDVVFTYICLYCLVSFNLMVTGLRLFHSAPPILSWKEITIHSIRRRLLVRAHCIAVCFPRSDGPGQPYGVQVCHDRDPVGLRFWRGSSGLVARHCSHRDKDALVPAPEPRVWIVPITSILERLPLIPVGDTGTIPFSMASKQHAYFPEGTCDRATAPGSGSKLFYINTWAMVWPSDHPV